MCVVCVHVLVCTFMCVRTHVFVNVRVYDCFIHACLCVWVFIVWGLGGGLVTAYVY